CQHRMHRVQLPRHSDRCQQQPRRDGRFLPDRQHQCLRHHAFLDAARPFVVVAGEDDELDAEMTGVAVRGAGPELTTPAGFSLLETVFALSLLLVVSLGLLPLGMIATTTTENQGHLMARTTEYAQDKLEQLLALTYGDLTSDTRVFPATDNG